MIAGVERRVSLGDVMHAVCLAWGVTHHAIASTSRYPEVVDARACYSHLARMRTGCSLPEIARYMGRPHHSTVYTASRRFAAMLAAGDPEAVEKHRAAEAVLDGMVKKETPTVTAPPGPVTPPPMGIGGGRPRARAMGQERKAGA